MTREEAIKKVGAVVGYDQRLIIALEALGLLKFDEAPKKQVEPDEVKEYKDSPSMVVRGKLVDLVNQPMQCADGIVNALYRAGYKIVDQSSGKAKLSKSIYNCGITQDNLTALNNAGYQIVGKSEVKKPMHKFRDAKGMIYFIHDEYLGNSS